MIGATSIRTVAATALLLAALVACSGSEPDAATTGAPAATQPTAVPASSGAVAGAPVTSAPVTSVPVTTVSATSVEPSTPMAPTTAVATDPSAGEWCAIAVDLHDLTSAFRELDADDTAAVRVSLVAILERLAAIEAVAPPGLAADLAVSAEAFQLLDAALATVDYRIADADLTELDARADAIEAANDRIRTYNSAECGIDIGVTGEDVP